MKEKESNQSMKASQQVMGYGTPEPQNPKFLANFVVPVMHLQYSVNDYDRVYFPDKFVGEHPEHNSWSTNQWPTIC